MHLGLHERALKNLAELDDKWDEIVRLIRRHNLYSQALSIFLGKSAYPVRLFVAICLAHLNRIGLDDC